MKKKYPAAAIREYAQSLATDILGPKPEYKGFFSTMFGTGQ